MSKRKTVATVAPAVEKTADVIAMPRTTGSGPKPLFMSPAAKKALDGSRSLADKYISRDGTPVTADDVRQAASEAANKDPLEYELERGKLAESLGVRRETLDSYVADARDEIEVESLRPVYLQDEVLWPTPVNGKELLDEIFTTIKRHISLSDNSALACSLWTLFAWTHDAYQISPLLLITSPEHQCGKSSLLKVISAMAPRALPPLVAPSVASIYRLVNEDPSAPPTLVLDENDAQNKSQLGELRAIMNGGHERDTASIPRVDHGTTRFFSLWAPKAVARIGIDNVHPSLLSRCIQIQMYRRSEAERAKAEKIPQRPRTAFQQLRQRCAKWTADNVEVLRGMTPALPESLDDRQQDNWFALIAVADLCGFGEEARACALKISKSKSDRVGYGPMLLTDMRRFFDETGVTEDATTTIIEWLEKLEDRSWGSWLHASSKPGTLASILKPYSQSADSYEPIAPVRLTIGDKRPLGYRKAMFHFAWDHFAAPLVEEARLDPTDPTQSGESGVVGSKAKRSRKKVKRK